MVKKVANLCSIQSKPLHRTTSKFEQCFIISLPGFRIDIVIDCYFINSKPNLTIGY